MRIVRMKNARYYDSLKLWWKDLKKIDEFNFLSSQAFCSQMTALYAIRFPKKQDGSIQWKNLFLNEWKNTGKRSWNVEVRKEC
jgi:hypothetical protein